MSLKKETLAEESAETTGDEEVSTGKLYSQHEALNNLIHLQKVMDKAAQSQGIFFTSMNGDIMRRGAISTGSLALDLCMGGGHHPGRFTYFYGPTGSGKSTVLYQSLIDPIQRNINVNFLDFEASTDPEYLEKLGLDLNDILGMRNKRGEWIVPPKLSYTQPNTVQQCFSYLRDLLAALPDKIMLMDGEEPRFFVVAPDFKYQPNWRSINDGLKKKKVLEVEDGSPQLVVMLDSINAMTPQAIIDRYGESESVALLARALSEGFNMTKSLFGSKMVNLIATNFLKINPMARMQNPETEPGGAAVQQMPDVKIKLMSSRSQASIVEEDHISGSGIDRYMNGTATIVKNKNGSVFRKISYRIWVDELGVPKGGFDPVFDTYTFLSETGQIGADTKGKFKILVPGFDSESLDMKTFKNFILTSPQSPTLKEALREQLRSGKAQEMYADTIKDRKTKDKPNIGFKVGVTGGPAPAAEEETSNVIEL